MNVKVIFLALFMSLSISLPSYSMDGDDVEIELIRIKSGENHGPRTGVPITASIESGIITTESNTYSGTIAVTIKDEDGETVLSTVENVSANSQFTTNVTSLADGTYTIYYTLGDTVYYGEFDL